MKVTFPYDVFLSHSSNDKSIVREVAQRLRADGVKVWFDEWIPSPAGAGEGGRRPGEGRGAKADSIPSKIEEGLERSRVLVLCMSANAFGSDSEQWLTASQPSTFSSQRTPAPLIKERRFISLWLAYAPQQKLPTAVSLHQPPNQPVRIKLEYARPHLRNR